MAIVKKYQAEVVKIENQVEGIYTIQLKPLSGRFKYRPGQFLHLALDEYDPSAGWPESRCFSMQSSPDEENIHITYAIKGAFTARMSRELRTGRIVALKLPYGDLFTQEHAKEDTVFIAGGTGITPFLSLFTDTSFTAYRNPVLFLGLRSKKFNIYQEQLNLAQKINRELRVKFIYQDEQGVLDIQDIHNNSPSAGCFFISGPPLMIRRFKTYLISAGINTDKVKTDEWE